MPLIWLKPFALKIILLLLLFVRKLLFQPFDQKSVNRFKKMLVKVEFVVSHIDRNVFKFFFSFLPLLNLAAAPCSGRPLASSDYDLMYTLVLFLASAFFFLIVL